MPDRPAFRRPPPLPAGRPRRIPRWVILLIAAAAAILVANAFGSTYLATYRLRREAARLERTVEQLRRENAQLREEIERLQDPEYIERLAREQLGLIRPGEIPVLLVRPTPTPRPTP